jgi:hypothetical protein
MIVNEIAKQLSINIQSAYSVVHDNLQFHEMCAKWVPEELVDGHKHRCLRVCSCHMANYCKEGDNFLKWIITGDETWVHHCQPETKRKSM